MKRILIVGMMLLLSTLLTYGQDTTLYILGDATPVGWDIGTPDPLIQDPNDSRVFSWEGVLVQGEFKFPLFTGDWCDSTWINSSQPDASISSGAFIYTQGCDGPDNKWRIQPGEEGTYRIVVYLDHDSVDVSPATSLSGELAGFSLYPNPSQGVLSVELGTAASADFTLMSLRGQVVYETRFQGPIDQVDLGHLALKGLHLVRIQTRDGWSIQKVLFE
jgi:hypothetical protein